MINVTLYKVVETKVGQTIAHLKHIGDVIVEPKDVSDTRVRVDKVLTEYIENNRTTAWGPVDKRTVYSVGEVTEADEVNTDVSIVSGAGLHAFREKDAALKWM